MLLLLHLAPPALARWPPLLPAAVLPTLAWHYYLPTTTTYDVLLLPTTTYPYLSQTYSLGTATYTFLITALPSPAAGFEARKPSRPMIYTTVTKLTSISSPRSCTLASLRFGCMFVTRQRPSSVSPVQSVHPFWLRSARTVTATAMSSEYLPGCSIYPSRYPPRARVIQIDAPREQETRHKASPSIP
ncbi:uncharacterized protein RAG0_11772 [Rhynchosporium agropyri]|uniref:Uncharacterized protein n=1 Tax=Rhynchosporium agropyri TaxID=914238 RepID=A0A1E1L5T3_9HELO|nr:uncharacterized protein RAG0_11772 [Rhynchosporium agropyri]